MNSFTVKDNEQLSQKTKEIRRCRDFLGFPQQIHQSANQHEPGFLKYQSVLSFQKYFFLIQIF